MGLMDRLTALRANLSCPRCDATGEDPDLATVFHEDCPYRTWQQASLACLEQEVGGEVLARLNLIQSYKQRYSCHMCGVCCRFASSEFSYAQLETKAAAGDAFATQFTSIFLPYASQEAARQKFPEIVDSVLAQADDPDTVYFYHCPYVGEDNRCTIYGTDKRPAICGSYPDTPLTFIYKRCAWRPWKDETHPDALWAHATLSLSGELADRIKAALTTQLVH
jgi:Fe-S-cluster containining protein